MTHQMPFLRNTEPESSNVSVRHKLCFGNDASKEEQNLQLYPRRIHRVCNFAHRCHKNGPIPQTWFFQMSSQGDSPSHGLTVKKAWQSFQLLALCMGAFHNHQRSSWTELPNVIASNPNKSVVGIMQSELKYL